MKTTVVKIITLACFFGLIGVFVSYRSGVFDGSSADKSLPLSHNGGVLNTNPVDSGSARQEADTGRRAPYTIPSSKSIVLPDDRRGKPALTDSGQTQNPDTSTRPRRRFMGGSKSAPIIEPQATPDSSKP